MKHLFLLILSTLIMIAKLEAQLVQPTFILVHGGWHGAWCWYKVVPLMKEKGFSVIAIDLPGHGSDQKEPATVTMDDYVKKVLSVANSTGGAVVLVGHSSGGTVIAQAAELLTPKKVAGLVFLDAFMPLDGESVFSLVQKFPSEPGRGAALAENMIVSADQKTTTLNLDKVDDLLYHDCSAEDKALAKMKLGAQPIAPQATPVSVTEKNYGSIPKFYIQCTEARDFDKSKLAGNVPCKKVYHLKSSHSPFFSMPENLVALFENIVRQL